VTEVQVFRSKLEDIMPAEELLFDPTPGFGYYAPWLKHAVAHPAKMNTWLLEFLIRAFTEPCDTVLDPMAGSGSTGIVAALHGRNAIQVELEKKFYEWMEKAKENVEKHPALTPKGRIVNICGDARRLSELLTQVGFEPTAAITSPPYSSTEFYYGEKSPEFWQKLAETTGRKAWLNPNSKTRKTIDEKEKPLSPETIGNLPLGEVSTIITSPPYADAKKGGEADKERMAERWDEAFKEKGETWNSWGKTWKTPGRLRGLEALGSGYSESKENIGNLPFGEVSAIITSPPYLKSAESGAGVNRQREGDVKIGCSTVGRTVTHPEAIDNTKEYGSIDAVITSPPYADGYSIREGGQVCREYVEKRRQKLLEQGKTELAENLKIYEYEARNPNNIGNLPLGNVDAVITSPPYEASVSDDKESPLVGGDEKKYGRWRKGTARKHSYTQHGEPCKVDTVITSPPYEGSLEGTTRHTRGGIASRDPALVQTGSYATVMSFGVPVGYSPSNDNIGNLKSSDEEYEELDKTIERLRRFGRTDPKAGGPYGRSLAHPYSPSKDNIGNLKSSDEEYEALANGLMKNGKPTYLSEMLKVYGEMFEVLKPGGLAIIVVKPFVRNKKVVDLPYHTWILMAKVGFRLARLYKLRLFRLSFWRILQYKKHPDVPIIAHEYVLVCQKPGSEPGKPVEPKIDPLIFIAETAAKKQAAKIL
jgi:DNA modification methylase